MKQPHFSLAITFLVILTISCGPSRNEAVESKPPLYSIEQFLKTESISGSSFSPDESKILFSSNKTGISNSYEVFIETGETKQLTSSTDDYARALSYFPKDERFLFTSDRGGNEINHIYLHDLNGSSRDLITDSTAKATFWGWSYDKKSFFYLSNARDPKFFDLDEMEITGVNKGDETNVFVSKTLYKNNNGYDVGAISRDKRYLALVETITTSNNNMYLHDMETGETKLLTQHEGDISYSPQYFSPDGTKLIYTTDENNEFAYLKTYDLSTGESEELEKTNWDIWYSYISRTGKYRVVASNEDARTNIKIYKNDGTRLELVDLPKGDISSVNISDSENLMSFYLNSSTSPRNMYIYNFSTKKIKRLTNTLSPDIDQKDLVEGKSVRFTSFDGMEIPALLFSPKGLQQGEKAPATLWIHGGPGGQTRLNYRASIQFLVNHGYVVMAVNNRGSSGYGKSFFKADDRRHGDVDLRDCIESKKYLKSLGYVDMNRIAITGGSYGGYMVMAALTFAPKEFDAGVDLYGVTNWLRTLKSIPPWWSSFKEALYTEMGDPDKDSVALYNKSPLFFAKNIVRPLIVLQGKNDPRVLKVESDEIVEAARSNGVPVEYVVFDDEGHGFVKKKNNIKAWESILEFLDKNMTGNPTSESD